MVHVDRDHFMDEFFEQVTEPTMPLDPERGPQPIISFSPSPPTSTLWHFTSLSGSGPFP